MNKELIKKVLTRIDNVAGWIRGEYENARGGDSMIYTGTTFVLELINEKPMVEERATEWLEDTKWLLEPQY